MYLAEEETELERERALRGQKALHDAAVTYARYLEPSSKTLSQIKTIDDAVENMLARLEEFTALLNSIGKEKDQITEKLIPLLLVKAKQLESLFTVIDTFQSYVDAVKNSVDQMEERVQKTEDKYNQLNPTSIGKVLGAFRLRSTSLTQRRSANTANATQDTNDSTTTTTTEEEQKNNNNKEKEQEQEEVVGAMPTWDPQTINIINTAELLNLKQSLLAGLSSS